MSKRGKSVETESILVVTEGWGKRKRGVGLRVKGFFLEC